MLIIFIYNVIITDLASDQGVGEHHKFATKHKAP